LLITLLISQEKRAKKPARTKIWIKIPRDCSFRQIEFRYNIADYFLTMSGSEPNHSIKKSISKQNSPSPVLWKGLFVKFR
jgi:hypothetical protein